MIEFLKHQLNTNPFFLTAAIASGVGAFMLYFKTFFSYLYEAVQRRFVFSAMVLQNDPLFGDFEVWFYAHYGEKYKNVEASVNEMMDYPSPLEYSDARKKHKVYFKQSEGIFFIRFEGKIIMIKKGREKLEHASDIRTLFHNQYHFYAIKGANHVKKLLETAVKFADKNAKSNELRIYAHSQYGDWSLASRISSKDIADVIINHEHKAELVRDMDVFLSAKPEYDRRSIFYKRGYGFHGGPGNGKTSLALAMATYLNKDIYCLDLNTITDNAYVKNLFINLKSNSMLLIEDIDAIFKLRELVNKHSKVSFATFLNCLDGAMYKEGLITVITTNKRDYLDPALIRAGRIDMMFEVPKPSIDEVNAYLKIFYNTSENITEYIHDYSMCDIQAICLENKTDYQRTVIHLKTNKHDLLHIA